MGGQQITDEKAAGNEYSQYKTLYKLETIAKQYPGAKDYLNKIRRLIVQLENKSYRVAVLGEFKRGKSSMINALLGVNVLPTDILPMTAVINHIVYGSEKKIIIQYKDGRTQEADINQIADYVTKTSQQQAHTAETVKEVKVFYPSIFCKNHIEIFDTPGLNDDDFMTDITLSILGEIDAVIVVISAEIPFSMTERNLIIKLLETREILNIIFVVTFIDRVSSDRDEQDKVIEHIRRRISEDTLHQAELLYGDDDRFMSKAGKILTQPKVFAVSSTLALRGFMHDDEDLLDESRFPEFKYALLETLTAAQGVDMAQKVFDAAEEAGQKIDEWYADKISRFKAGGAEGEEARRQCDEYINFSGEKLDALFHKIDHSLAGAGFDMVKGLQTDTLPDILCRFFIVSLSSLHKDQLTAGNVASAVFDAADKALKYMEELRRRMETILGKSYDAYKGTREKRYTDIVKNTWNIKIPGQELDSVDISLPQFVWRGKMYPDNTDLANADIMPFIRSKIRKTLEDFSRIYIKRISSYKKALLSQNRSDKECWGMVRAQYDKVRENTAVQRKMCDVQYQKHKKELQMLKGGNEYYG